ncbi:MAG: O-antigen ligase family protein, partial [Planctomycetes bacterium]|nr:O-antigen ligase family protein [Planctomycetota bacterium]
KPVPAPKPKAKPAPKPVPAPKPKAKPAPKPAPAPKPKAKPAPKPAPAPKPKAKPAPKPAPAPKPEAKPAPPKEQPKEQPKKEDKKQPDGGGIGLPFAQQAPQPTPAQPAAQAPSAPAEEGEGAIARLIGKIPHARFTLADALVWIIFVLWVVKIIVYKEIKQVRLFPLPILVFVILAILSMVIQIKSIDKPSAVKELLQYIEYFILGYLIIANNADTEKSFRRIVRLLILTSTIVITVAMFQYWSSYCPCVKDTAGKLGPLSGPLTRLLHVDKGDAMGIRGTFSNRNVLGAYLALMLPFLWGIALAHKKGLAIVTRTWAVILTVAGLSVMTSGGAMLAVLFSILAITFIRDEKFFSILAVLVLVFAIGAGLFLKSKLQRLEAKYAARPNITMLQDSIKLFKQSDAAKRGYGWQQRYVEWQAAVNAITVHPIFGVGVGNYQQNINQYYGEILKPAENYMEADAMNGLLVLAMTMGIPGLVAFLWILFKFQKFGAQGFSLLPASLEKGFALGIYGAMTSVLIASLFTNVLVRGVGIVFVILLALAGQVNDLSPDEAPEEPKEGDEKAKS